ncbi:peptidase family M48-domain-containing protein [Elsinoe ampelina]|uniref:Peptidase family M48-domain-containing protein n=1 Tax=Elsinoe ampelina TaxID=302913 RepID=A0A6A6FZG9_9PEZI|nr:peptidase family M48-domain-containing protein [Elsinoe ampelina]
MASRPRWRLFSALGARQLPQPASRLQPLRSRILPQLQSRTFSRTTPQRARYNYNRFKTTTNLLHRWAQSPTFYYQIGFISAGVGGFYISNLEEVPVSGRRRFNFISDDFVRRTSETAFQQTLDEFDEKILPETHPLHRMTERVLQRLLPHSGFANESSRWTVHVIDDKTKNAFVLPGGHVFVFRGILDVAQGEDGLAAVLGHEIAHNVANHVGERLSQSWVLMPVAFLVSFFLGLDDLSLTRLAVEYAFDNPHSRKQESEADYIGLIMMSEACYDPSAAADMWERMDQLEKRDGGGPPQFLSTHPASRNRMESIKGWLPKAEAKREQSGCFVTGFYADDFGRAFSRWT